MQGDCGVVRVLSIVVEQSTSPDINAMMHTNLVPLPGLINFPQRVST